MKRIVPLLIVCACAGIVATPAQAQGIGDRLKAKVADKLAQRADEGTDALMARFENAVKCLVTDDKCIKKAKDEGKPIVLTDKSGKAMAEQPYLPKEGASGSTLAPPATFVNYDFVPGNRVLFAEDFADEKVGDPASRIKLLSGNSEVATVGGNKMLRATSFTSYMIPLPEKLPERFTLEFDAKHNGGWDVSVFFVPDGARDGLATFYTSEIYGGVMTKTGKFGSGPSEDLAGQMYHVRLMVDGAKAKLYLNGKRVANVPDAPFGRANGVWIDVGADEDRPALIDNIRVAESPTTLFDVLMAKGRVATQGILFDTNSDVLRPESLPTLQQIGDMLTANPQLKLLIEGHTDNVGGDATNLTLSDRRAAAVRTYLIAKYSIDQNRLQSKGFGASKPTAPNTTAEGRQMNRRVELVKL